MNKYTKHLTDESRLEAKRECNRLYMRKTRQTKPLQNKIRTLKESAKKRGIFFNLTVHDINVPEMCPLLNIPLSSYGPLCDNTLSIDRIDNSKGYTPDNIQVISYKANTMKSNSTKEELILFAKNVLKYYGEN